MIPPEANARFVAAMEDVLTVSARPVDPARPLICFDEAGKALTRHTRPPQPLAPGQPAREDTEYERHGSANLFLVCAPHLGWRQITGTDQRTALDFAQRIRELVDGHFPHAERITLGLDNLNTPTPAALSQAFPPAEAWRLLQTLEWHFTPIHGRWLTIAEREWSVVQRQCLDRRIPDRPTLEAEVAAWVTAHNQTRTPVDWRFTVADAREKLVHVYPIPQQGTNA